MIFARPAAGLVLAAVGIYGGVHLVRVHQESRQLPPDSHPLGHTPGGGQIFGPAQTPFVPTSITVRDGGTLISYELSGGP